MGHGLSKEQAGLPFAYVRYDSATAELLDPSTPTLASQPPARRPSPPSSSSPRQRSLSSSTRQRPAGPTHSYSLNDLDDILSGRGRGRARPVDFTVPVSSSESDSDEGIEDGEESLEGVQRALQRAEEEADPSLKAITFGQLTSLTTIGLCEQSLAKVSANIALLQMTTTLQLCCNDLTSIPPEVGYMKNLTSLSVAKNRLTTLPDTIGHLTKLTDLNASENLLKSIPSSIRYLLKLTKLDVHQNCLRTVPAELGHLKSLAVLDISDNAHITTIPAEVGRLKFLRKLDMRNCTSLLESFPTGPFPATPPTLKELSARVIVRHQLPILSITQESLKTYLASAHTCSFCGGPYFECFESRGKMVERQPEGPQIPMEYRLCVPHWGTEEERVSMMFCPMPGTAPSSPLVSPKGSPISNPNLSRRRNGGNTLPTSSSSSSLSSLRQASQPQNSTNPYPHAHANMSAEHVLLSSDSGDVGVRGLGMPLMSMPLSALTKSPSLPSLPSAALENRSLKKRLLEKSGMKPRRAISYGVVG
ncbi:Leucine-rich repeat-containing protein 63 [Rhizophlyctis rosea]|uniref:Leucine-rich repeat-containing protein 63 n=1 Tax=Rhizophlyctis rosea TaxID=64517 RepID=A0AAD5SI76_9FUNG|nr:Leucine-rich repeat-containing protein 63 [Rhizophlyctis rosea]